MGYVSDIRKTYASRPNGEHLRATAKHRSTPHDAVMLEGFLGEGVGLTWIYIMPRETSLTESQGNFVKFWRGGK